MIAASTSTEATSFRADVVGSVFFVRWLAPPQWSSAQAMLAQLAQLASARAAAAGKPLVFCAILPDSAGPPAKELRSRMGTVVAEIRRHCDRLHVVLVGRGVVASLLRTVIRGAVVASRLSAVVSIHDAVEDVLEQNADRLGLSPESVMNEARARGLVD